jgi:hypothetical protein
VSELLNAAGKARTLTGQIHDAVDDWEICGRLPGPVSPASIRKAQMALGQIDEVIVRLLAVRDVWGRSKLGFREPGRR